MLRSRVSASDAEIAESFQKNKASYRIPEKRSYLIFPISEEQLAASLEVPEAQLREIYQRQQDRFRTEERVQVRHILIKTIDRPASELPSLEKKAQDLLKQLKGGADFAELAKKHSEDPGSASKGGDLGFVTRGQTVPEFEKAAFSLKPKEISDVVKTQYGFHIIQVLAHEQARLRPFEEVRAELAAEAKRAQVYDRMQGLADQIRLALVRSREEAEKIARENGITPVRAENVGLGDPVQEIGINEQFNAAVRELPVNGVTPVIQVGTNRLVVAQVTAITPPRDAELKEVIAQVREAVISRKANELAARLLADLEAKVKSGAGNFEQLAKEVGGEVKSTDFITRNSSIEGIGPAMMAEEAFSRDPGAIVGPIRTADGGGFFAKVLEKRPPDMTQFAAQKAGILQELKRQRARDRSELLRAGIVDELTRKKKIKIYEDNIKRLVAAYSSTS
ncbi:MAG: peptidylprolyl isomerase [Bryobacteraceae bacterium]|nr:peptidylprolyl isomerase [Bryobacteraceae bacterium]MCX7604086.1 peptidylprolyl isomerase [Bryobacteraceae bacterium]